MITNITWIFLVIFSGMFLGCSNTTNKPIDNYYDFTGIERELEKAIINDNLEDVKKTIAKGANINAISNRYKRSFLYTAIYHGKFSIAKYLLANKVNPNIKDIFNQSSLSLVVLSYVYWPKAIEKNHKPYAELLPLLLKYGANPNTTDTSGNPIIMLLIERGKFEEAELFRKYGASLNTLTNTNGKTLDYITYNGKKRLTLDKRTHANESMLLYFAKDNPWKTIDGRWDSVWWLLKNGAKYQPYIKELKKIIQEDKRNNPFIEKVKRFINKSKGD